MPVHIIAVRVHQIAPPTHKYPHMNPKAPNDRVTVFGYRIVSFHYKEINVAASLAGKRDASRRSAGGIFPWDQQLVLYLS